MPRVKPKAKPKLYAPAPRKPKRGFLHRVGIFVFLAIVIGGSGTFFWSMGWPQQLWTLGAESTLRMTAQLGFGLDDIVLKGRKFSSHDDVLTALQVKRGMPILAIDQTAALQRLEHLPWVAGVTVERRLPQTLYVHLQEREPLARWQYKNRVQVIDVDGKVLPPAAPRDFNDLPLVVGEGAEANAAELLDALASYPNIKQILRAAVRVGSRRWDIMVEPGVTVRLPEGQEEDGLKRLTALMGEQQILTRDIIAIDLRVLDRPVLERPPVNPAAATKPAATPKI